MKTIYLDNNFCCHLTLDEPFLTIETSFFDDKCQTYIEGYRFIPDNYTWTGPDGETYLGLMICPTIELTLLNTAQTQYEEDLAQIMDMQGALDILGVKP